MKMRVGLVLSLAACVVVAGCGKKEPKGQVVATVNGEEITAIDLRNEMGDFRAPDAATRKLAERQALEQIIERRLLVGAAEKRKLDKTPEFAQQKQRMEEALVVRYWQNQVAKAVPPPSKDEVDRFIAANPDVYGQHRVFVLDQIRMPMTRDRALLEGMKPLKSLPEVAAFLTSKGVRFQQGVTQMDALQAPPPVVAQIMKLPADDVFVVPQGNLLAVNKVQEARIVPIPPELAARHATQFLLQQRTQQAVERELGGALAAARQEKDAVKYAKAYEPTPAKPAAATPAKK